MSCQWRVCVWRPSKSKESRGLFFRWYILSVVSSRLFVLVLVLFLFQGAVLWRSSPERRPSKPKMHCIMSKHWLGYVSRFLLIHSHISPRRRRRRNHCCWCCSCVDVVGVGGNRNMTIIARYFIVNIIIREGGGFRDIVAWLGWP